MAQNEEEQKKAMMKKLLLLFNCLLLAIGNCGGPMILRLYFLHGGNRVWLSSCLQTAGWPIIFIPLAFSYFNRRRRAGGDTTTTTKLILMKPRLFFAVAFIGALTGFNNYLYAYGVARLPVSTSSLITASQLAFTAVFAFFLVKQRLTSYSINAVVLMTAGGAVLVLHSGGDRSTGESSKQYLAGFLMTLAAAFLYGIMLPLMELAYKKAKQTITYTLVLEIQLVMSLFATIVCLVGMLVNHDFQAIPREAREYGLGVTSYYLILAINAITWQSYFLGAIGVIFCSSSLFSGVMIAVLLPITQILAVIFYHEKFQSEKGVSLFLNIWGFVSYFYGEMRLSKTQKKQLSISITEPNLNQITNL